MNYNFLKYSLLAVSNNTSSKHLWNYIAKLIQLNDRFSDHLCAIKFCVKQVMFILLLMQCFCFVFYLSESACSSNYAFNNMSISLMCVRKHQTLLGSQPDYIYVSDNCHYLSCCRRSILSREDHTVYSDTSTKRLATMFKANPQTAEYVNISTISIIKECCFWMMPK